MSDSRDRPCQVRHARMSKFSFFFASVHLVSRISHFVFVICSCIVRRAQSCSDSIVICGVKWDGMGWQIEVEKIMGWDGMGFRPICTSLVRTHESKGHEPRSFKGLNPRPMIRRTNDTKRCDIGRWIV